MFTNVRNLVIKIIRTVRHMGSNRQRLNYTETPTD